MIGANVARGKWIRGKLRPYSANLLSAKWAALLTEQGWSGIHSDQRSESRQTEAML
jgi:hypothetical protein